MRTLVLSDGRKMAWREKGAGPSVALLHGWGMSSAVYAEALEALSGDFRLLAPDLRGHGASNPGPGYGLDDFASDLKEWMETLGLTQVRLLGWSLGGEIALRLFPQVRSRVDRLALVATTPSFTIRDDWTNGLPEGQVRAMARDLRRNLEKTMGDFFMKQFAGESLSRLRLRQILDFSVRNVPLPPLDVVLAALETLRCADLRGGLSHIDCPSLVMHGLQDNIVPFGAGESLAEALPQSQLQAIEGVGHAPFLSRPSQIFQNWQEFFLA